MVMTIGTYQRSGDDVLQQQWGVPSGIAPSATWNNSSGNFTLDTALDQVYSKGLWLRFSGVNINSSTGGPTSSGLYWCIMNSTTSGQAYALQPVNISTPVPVTLPLLTGTTPFVPYVPLTSQLNGLLPTTAGTHGPSVAGAYLVAASVIIPGNLMGANGSIRTDCVFSCNGSVNTKQAAPGFGGTVFYGQGTSSASQIMGVITSITRNRGFTNSQVNSPIGNVTLTFSSYQTVDTTVDQLYYFTLNIGTTATDWMILQGGTVEVFPAT
jgi:hypothetical protein